MQGYFPSQSSTLSFAGSHVVNGSRSQQQQPHRDGTNTVASLLSPETPSGVQEDRNNFMTNNKFAKRPQLNFDEPPVKNNYAKMLDAQVEQKRSFEALTRNPSLRNLQKITSFNPNLPSFGISTRQLLQKQHQHHLSNSLDTHSSQSIGIPSTQGLVSSFKAPTTFLYSPPPSMLKGFTANPLQQRQTSYGKQDTQKDENNREYFFDKWNNNERQASTSPIKQQQNQSLHVRRGILSQENQLDQNVNEYERKKQEHAQVLREQIRFKQQQKAIEEKQRQNEESTYFNDFHSSQQTAGSRPSSGKIISTIASKADQIIQRNIQSKRKENPQTTFEDTQTIPRTPPTVAEFQRKIIVEPHRLLTIQRIIDVKTEEVEEQPQHLLPCTPPRSRKSTSMQQRPNSRVNSSTHLRIPAENNALITEDAPLNQFPEKKLRNMSEDTSLNRLEVQQDRQIQDVLNSDVGSLIHNRYDQVPTKSSFIPLNDVVSSNPYLNGINLAVPSSQLAPHRPYSFKNLYSDKKQQINAESVQLIYHTQLVPSRDTLTHHMLNMIKQVPISGVQTSRVLEELTAKVHREAAAAAAAHRSPWDSQSFGESSIYLTSAYLNQTGSTTITKTLPRLEMNPHQQKLYQNIFCPSSSSSSASLAPSSSSSFKKPLRANMKRLDLNEGKNKATLAAADVRQTFLEQYIWQKHLQSTEDEEEKTAVDFELDEQLDQISQILTETDPLNKPSQAEINMHQQESARMARLFDSGKKLRSQFLLPLHTRLFEKPLRFQQLQPNEAASPQVDSHYHFIHSSDKELIAPKREAVIEIFQFGQNQQITRTDNIEHPLTNEATTTNAIKQEDQLVTEKKVRAGSAIAKQHILEESTKDLVFEDTRGRKKKKEVATVQFQEIAEVDSDDISQSLAQSVNQISDLEEVVEQQIEAGSAENIHAFLQSLVLRELQLVESQVIDSLVVSESAVSIDKDESASLLFSGFFSQIVQKSLVEIESSAVSTVISERKEQARETLKQGFFYSGCEEEKEEDDFDAEELILSVVTRELQILERNAVNSVFEKVPPNTNLRSTTPVQLNERASSQLQPLISQGECARKQESIYEDVQEAKRRRPRDFENETFFEKSVNNLDDLLGVFKLNESHHNNLPPPRLS